jgi:hypothetical protein
MFAVGFADKKATPFAGGFKWKISKIEVMQLIAAPLFL